MPENKNQKINPNISESGPSTASSSSTSSQKLAANISSTKGKGKETINIVNELDLVIEKTAPLSVNLSGQSEKDLAEFLLVNQSAKLTPKDKKNKLFHMKENERQELAEQFSGLDRILYDRLEKKVGTKQEKTEHLIFGQTAASILNLVPVVGNIANIGTINAAFAVLDNHQIALEQSFSVNEVKEIVEEYQAETQNQLIAIRDYMLEENQELQDAKEEIGRLTTEAAQFISQQQTREAKEQEILEQKQRAIKDKAELETINANYEKLLTEAKNQEEQIAAKNKAISDYIRLINQKEQEKDILKSEWVILNTKIGTIEAQKVLLRNQVQSQKDEVKRKELEISHRNANELRLIDDKQKAQAESENRRVALVAAYKERDELRDAMAPQWLQKTAYWIDWALETELQAKSSKIWAKGKLWGRMLFLALVVAVLLYLLSWVIRILVATCRNIKAIFTKKQDTATVLKDLVSGMKEAKDTLTSRKKSEKEKNEEKVLEIIEDTPLPNEKKLTEPKPDGENQEPDTNKKNSKNGKKTKKKPKNKK